MLLKPIRGSGRMCKVLTTAHIASGAAVGTLIRSRMAAVAVGVGLHYLGDKIPHEDVTSKRFEFVTGLGAVALLAYTRGPFSPSTICGAFASSPDLEHILPLPKPGGKKIFPTHRGHHASGGVPVWLQLVGAGAVLASVAAAGLSDSTASVGGDGDGLG